MTDIELVRDFVNTRNILDEAEELATAAQLERWLGEHGLLCEAAGTSAADLRRALELREALRLLLLGNTGLEVDAEGASAVLDGVARRARVELGFEGGGAVLRPGAKGAAAALGRLVVAVQRAMADGSWPRLKACRARDCEWAFIDHAKNRSRSWCSMRVCGNREKARVYRDRHRGEASSSSR